MEAQLLSFRFLYVDIFREHRFRGDHCHDLVAW